MTNRKDLKREYKEREKAAGVFQVKNLRNGKLLLGSSLNLEGPINRHRFALKIGKHPNPEMQKDWNELGPENFVFEILQVVEKKDAPGFKLEDELAILEEIWLEELNPLGENGYNVSRNIRQA